MDSKDVAVWSCIASLLIALLSCLLMFTPTLILIASRQRTIDPTPLESYLSLHLGVWLFAVALALLLNIPASPPTPQPSSSSPSASRHPLLVPVTGASLLTSFLSYNTDKLRPLSFFVFLAFGSVGIWGSWVLLFASSSYVSRKTGADKHTSAFIFGNKSAASVQKKQWQNDQQGNL